MSTGGRSGAGTTSIERRVLAAIDHAGLLDLLSELIAVPSLDGRESDAQRDVVSWLSRQSLDADVWAIDLEELARHPQYSAEVARTEATGVVGSVGEPARPGAGRDLLLNGHIDVVPPGDEGAWASSPWLADVRGGRVYGRGTADMKGGLCCALFAAKAVRDAGVRLKGRLSVASVVGEEDGGTGTLGMLLRGHRADGAVIVEPTDLRVVAAQAGSLMFRLIVPGRAAHGSVRDEGVSAIEKFLPLFGAIRRLEAERCGAEATAGRPADHARDLFEQFRLPWPIEVGTIRAGDWASNVPATLIAEGRYGLALGEDPGTARCAFEDAIARAALDDPWLREHAPQVEWWGGRFDPAVTDRGHPIVTTVVGAVASVAGAAPPIEGVPYGADMRLLVNVGGIPTVLFGPGDIRVAHTPDEFVPVAQLRAATEALVLTALRFCGVRDD